MMNERDDMQELAELAGAMGDDGQMPQAAAPAESEPPLAEKPAVIEPRDDFAGGLNGAIGIDETRETAMDFDELLGIGKPAAAPVHEPEGGAAAPEPSTPAPGSAEARIAELADRLRKAEEDRDKLMSRLLGDTPATEQNQPAADGGNPEIDPGSSEFLRPYIRAEAEAMVAERLGAVEQVIAPLRQQAESLEIAAAIATVVPGFKPEHLPILEAEFDKITDPRAQAIYGDRIPGAALFARALEERGVLDFGQRKSQPRVSPLAGRHNVAGGGARLPTGDASADEDATVRRIMSADPEAFLNAARARGFDV